MLHRLFVYGTLRKGVGGGMSRMLASRGRLVGPARVQGRLHDLGEYPGLVPSRDAGSWVRGEVYELHDPARTLVRLDAYEGCGPDDPRPHEFERVESNVLVHPAEEATVWVYVYKGPLSGRPVIPSGDYLRPRLP